ncbi:MAG TPA: dihydrodipicolinate synthase family protein [Candidatus Acidoferrales bacterium]|jgi:4-hydroxy-2-oxoglutarate aldolase|nr:dihydrodipicolinate synthase family protein [Candidatus Acidoferrales bacterium]
MGRKPQLKGIIPALTTPFEAHGAVALGRLSENIGAYNRTGLSGYLAFGSTGESVLLDRAEFERVLATVREAAAPGRILIAGTGAESTVETISRTEVAAKLGYDYALVCPPCYYKPAMNSQVLVEHYRRVADASRIPILLYSVPQYTGLAIEVDVAARLSEHSNVAGMKDSSGNVDRVGAILAAVPDTFELLTGSSTTILPSMAVGAKGGILALADFLPELCVALYDAIVARDAQKSLELQRRLIPATNRIVGAMGIAGVKYATDRRGYYGGPVRGPLLPLDESRKAEVEVLMASLAPMTATV